MAIRTKTIEIPAASNTTTLAAATRVDIFFESFRLAEMTSCNFLSAIIELTVHDNITVAASITSWLIGIKFGAGSFDDATVTATITNSGEHETFIVARDVTALMNTNFSNLGLITISVGVQIGGIATLPLTAKLILTYEYDDVLTALETGTSTAATTSSVTDSSQSWVTNQFGGSYLHITSGAASGEIRPIDVNNATVISTAVAFSVSPGIGATYEVIPGRTKTVRIPIESPLAVLTSSLAELGTNQIPNLSTFLPEANKRISCIWFESVYNDGGNATTDFNLALALDAAGEVSRGTLEMALNSANWGKDIWPQNSMSQTAVHAFKARSSTASRFSLLSTLLCVTYTYNPSETTTVIQSLAIPFAGDAGFIHTSGQPHRIRIPVWIEEPGTITMKQSGFLMVQNEPTTQNLIIDVGAQSSRTYVLTAGSLQTGPTCLMHRIDAGGGGAADCITLARGLNNIDIDYWAATASAFSNLTGLLYLNYTSSVHSEGEGVHNHTTIWNTFVPDATLTTHRVTAPTALFDIPESEWFLNNVGFCIYGAEPNAGGSVSFLVLEAEVLSGESPAEGWREIYSSSYKNDAEMHTVLTFADSKEQFQRWVGDPDTSKLALETSRNYKLNIGIATTLGVMAYLTYHAITFDIAGTVSGYAGDGEDIPVNIYRTDNNELVLETTTGAVGAFSATWYDDTIELFAEAREDDTHVGRSADEVAT